jgi:hypothetical protein
MAFFLKNPMMNSFGRQEGGGFRWREGKLVSPVRPDYPLHPNKTPAARKREKKHGGRRSETPPKRPPPERKGRRKRRKRKRKRDERREEGRGEKKDVNERKK